MRSILGLDFGNVIKRSGDLVPMPGVVDSFPALKTFFNEIVLISRVEDDSGEAKTLNFLDEFNLRKFFTHLRFCHTRLEKAVIAEELEVSHFVDDRTECLHYMDSVSYRFALRPTSKQMCDFPPYGMFVAKDWQQLMPVLLTLSWKEK